MPDYPGVYIEEISSLPNPIPGVPTHTAAFLGETEKGPTLPTLVTSLNEYQRLFGGPFATGKYLPHAIKGFFENGGRRAFICRATGSSATTASASLGSLTLRAIGPGQWGNRIVAKVSSSPRGFRLEVAYYLNATPPPDPFAEPFQLPRPDQIEEFQNVMPQAGSNNSVLVTCDPGSGPPSDGIYTLSGGADSSNPISIDDYQLDRLEEHTYRHIALIYAPNASVELARAIISHCEKVRFRFAVIDAPQGQSNHSQLRPRSALADSSFASYYYPWLRVVGQNASSELIPPGGHVLGIFARNDIEQGVFKAPANQLVRGAQSLEFQINAATGEILNSEAVNTIRFFEGRGIRLWGARTLSSNPLWKYVSLRRYFIFLEQSIYEGTQWVVFEPNHEPLWSRVQQAIYQFLRTQWTQGALQGSTDRQAFYVKCDRTTMTQDDINNGRLICEIGIAAVRPAEFIIFRIGQKTASANS